MNDNVLCKVDELIGLIKESNEYKKYIDIKNKMNKDLEITELVNEIRALQKKAVKNDISINANDKINDQINDKYIELNSYPIYKEYLYQEEELNNAFQLIKNTLESYINSIVK